MAQTIHLAMNIMTIDIAGLFRYVQVTKLQDIKKTYLNDWKHMRQRDIIGKMQQDLLIADLNKVFLRNMHNWLPLAPDNMLYLCAIAFSNIDGRSCGPYHR